MPETDWRHYQGDITILLGNMWHWIEMQDFFKVYHSDKLCGNDHSNKVFGFAVEKSGTLEHTVFKLAKGIFGQSGNSSPDKWLCHSACPPVTVSF